MKFTTGVRKSPRRTSETISVPTEPLSQFSDLIFVDTRVFAKSDVDWILDHQDLLELNHIYPEYLPYLGLRSDCLDCLDCPQAQLSVGLHHILGLCYDQLYSQQSSNQSSKQSSNQSSQYDFIIDV